MPRRWRVRLLALLILLSAGIGWFLSGARPPSDESVVGQFRLAQHHLDNLRLMLNSDSEVESVSGNGVTTDKSIVAKPPVEIGMAEGRFQQYLANLRLAKAISAIHKDREYRFMIEGSGFGSHGWRLSFVYRESPSNPAELIDSIDSFRPKGGKWRQGYRHLEGNWYAWII